jgi:hypothetical protein
MSCTKWEIRPLCHKQTVTLHTGYLTCVKAVKMLSVVDYTRLIDITKHWSNT